MRRDCSCRGFFLYWVGFSGKMGSIFPGRVPPRPDCGAAAPRSGAFQQVFHHAVLDGVALWVGGYDSLILLGVVPGLQADCDRECFTAGLILLRYVATLSRAGLVQRIRPSFSCFLRSRPDFVCRPVSDGLSPRLQRPLFCCVGGHYPRGTTLIALAPFPVPA